MRGMRWAFTAAIVALLTACGGGGESAGPPNAACVPATTVYVQMFGDSTQAGYTTNPDNTSTIVASNPAAALQAFFTKRYGAGAVIVSSRAVSGTTAKELVAGTDHLNAPWPGSVQADIVVVNHGINDLTHDGDLTAYQLALRKLATAPALVIFETPNAVKEWNLAPYAQVMRDVAKENGLAVVDTYAFTADKVGQLSDWAHPTDELYTRISELVQPVVAVAVSRLRCEL